MENYFSVLKLKPGCDLAEIRKAYTFLAKRYHPDVNSDADAAGTFEQIHTAYTFLLDHDKRASLETLLKRRKMDSKTGINDMAAELIEVPGYADDYHVNDKLTFIGKIHGTGSVTTYYDYILRISLDDLLRGMHDTPLKLHLNPEAYYDAYLTTPNRPKLDRIEYELPPHITEQFLFRMAHPSQRKGKMSPWIRITVKLTDNVYKGKYRWVPSLAAGDAAFAITTSQFAVTAETINDTYMILTPHGLNIHQATFVDKKEGLIHFNAGLRFHNPLTNLIETSLLILEYDPKT